MIDIQQETNESTGVSNYKITAANIIGSTVGTTVFFVGESTTVASAIAALGLGNLSGAVASVGITYNGITATFEAADAAETLTRDAILDLLTSDGYMELEESITSTVIDLMESVDEVIGKTTGWSQQPTWLNNIIEMTDSTLSRVSDLTSFLKDSLSDAVDSAQTIGTNVSSFLTTLTQAEATQPTFNRDPLTLDLDGDGIDLVSLSNSSTFFDLDNDGLKEQVGWVKGDDGFLVYDSNGNNNVDNITELFGYEDENGNLVSGTEELKTYDLNNDGVINSSDSIYSSLEVWQDSNQDGISDSGELKSLSNLNISSINLNNLTTLNQNINGNVILSEGSYTKETTETITNSITNSDGTISETTSTITTESINSYSNLNLSINQTNSSSYEYTDSEGNSVSYDLNLETLTLPFPRGYGNTKAWHIAMSEDDTLLTQMKQITNPSEYNLSYSDLDTLIETFIYQWTNTQDITGTRGSFDARKLAAMEEVRGIDYHDIAGSSNVGVAQVSLVESAWETLVKEVKGKILIQGNLSEIFTDSNGNEATYDFATDSIDFNDLTSTQLLTNLESEFNSLDPTERPYLIYQLTSVANAIAGQIDGITQATDFTDQLKETFGYSIDGAIYGDSSDNNLYNSSSQSYLIEAASGNDHVYGSSNSDFINGGEGDDMLFGGKGDDTYIFNKGDGVDLINDLNNNYSATQSYGNDKILLGEGLNKEDIYFSTDNNGYLNVKFRDNSSDQINIKYYDWDYAQIESLELNDGEVIDLSDLSNYNFEYYGTEENDSISANGAYRSSDGKGYDAIVDAKGGNDVIYTGDGNNIINAGTGDDLIYDWGGSDIYIYNLGDGKDYISDNGGAADKIVFGSGISKEDLNFSKNNHDLIVGFNNNDSDQITIEGYFYKEFYKDWSWAKEYGIESLEFADGSVLDISETSYLTNNLPNAKEDSFSLDQNSAITINLSEILANDSDLEDGITIQNITLDDVVFGDVSNGTITKDYNNNTITYKPNSNFNGTDSLTYQIKDSSNALSNKAQISFNITATNNNPTASIANLTSQTTTVGKEFYLKLDPNLFSDVDGDQLQISVTQSDGSSLPSWLKFNSQTMELSGTPSNADAGLKSLSIIASDGLAQAEIAFDLTIENTGQTLVGSNKNDILAGADGNDTIKGNSGNDTIYGGDGDDKINGNAGNDILSGDSGNDILNGDNGSDTIYGGDGNDKIDGGNGKDILNGDAGHDTLNGGLGNDTLNGGSGSDNLNGNDGHDILNGDDGNDILRGSEGNDILNGNDGNDIIFGGVGNDSLIGGLGIDKLTGGEGMDVFSFTNLADSTNSQTDVILDFIQNEDKIDLSQLEFDSISKGQGSSTSEHGLEYYFKDSNTIIDDPDSDFLIKLAGQIELNNGDFVF